MTYEGKTLIAIYQKAKKKNAVAKYTRHTAVRFTSVCHY